jgi:hypothetical protein
VPIVFGGISSTYYARELVTYPFVDIATRKIDGAVAFPSGRAIGGRWFDEILFSPGQLETCQAADTPRRWERQIAQPVSGTDWERQGMPQPRQGVRLAGMGHPC